jgi:hypothetical protein
MPALLPNRNYAACLHSAVLAIAAVVLAVPANACPTLPREVEKRRAKQWRQDRLKADAVVVGTWYRAENEAECGGFEKPCVGKIVAEKVRRGEILAEYLVTYVLEFNMCDARNMAPYDGARAKFYINGSPEARYYLVDTVWIERE